MHHHYIEKENVFSYPLNYFIHYCFYLQAQNVCVLPLGTKRRLPIGAMTAPVNTDADAL